MNTQNKENNNYDETKTMLIRTIKPQKQHPTTNPKNPTKPQLQPIPRLYVAIALAMFIMFLELLVGHILNPYHTKESNTPTQTQTQTQTQPAPTPTPAPAPEPTTPTTDQKTREQITNNLQNTATNIENYLKSDKFQNKLKNLGNKLQKDTLDLTDNLDKWSQKLNQ